MNNPTPGTEMIVTGDTLRVYDAAIPDWRGKNFVWEWNPGSRYRGFNGANDAKVRRDAFGDEYVVLCGGTWVMVVPYRKEPDAAACYVVDTGYKGLHGVELLPNGLIASSSPGADRIQLHRIGQDVVWGDQFYAAHSLLWDESRSVLWAAGHSQSPQEPGGHGMVRKYPFDPETGLLGEPETYPVDTYPESLPKLPDKYNRPEWADLKRYSNWWEGLHDIAPVPGDEHAFLLSTDARLFLCHPGADPLDRFEDVSERFGYLCGVKGVSAHPDTGQVCMLPNDTKYDFGSTVRFFEPPQDRPIAWNKCYKARWVQRMPGWDATLVWPEK
ncbi:hypothetical protein AB0C51_22630 [Streptomyces pathocidini]|uniref:hypothetical protein n=1 Tax=Streptomyces pathocidini TaxID=1650571 RepID=UPI0033C3530C